MRVVGEPVGPNTAQPAITNYKSKWRNIWIRDVFPYLYGQDKCPIMMLVHDRALVWGVQDPSTFGPNQNTPRIQCQE